MPDKRIESTDGQLEIHRSSTELPSRDPVRRRSLELKRQELDDDLKSKQEILDRIDSLYRDWNKLKAKSSKNRKILKETSEHITQTKQDQTSLERENTRIEKALDKLPSRNLRQQETALKSLLTGEVAPSTAEIIKESLTMIQSEKENINNNIYIGIKDLRDAYPALVKKARTSRESAKKSTIEMLTGYGIEINISVIDSYISENANPIKDSKECIARINEASRRAEYITSKEAKNDNDRECIKKWDGIELTRFYQQKVKLYVSRYFCTVSIEVLDAAIQFAGNSETVEQGNLQKFFEKKTEDTKRQQESFKKTVDKTYAELEVGLKQPGFKEVHSFYKALLDQYEQALKALAKKDELQRNLDTNPNAPIIERQRWEKGIEFIERAVADLDKSIEDQKNHYRDLMQQKYIREYSVIGNLYRAMVMKNSSLAKSREALVISKGDIKGYDKQIAAARTSQNDDIEFGNKLKAYIEARVFVERQIQMHLDNMKAICDYYDSIAVTPLRQIISQNQEAIANIEEDATTHQTFYDQKKKEQDAIEAAIEGMRRTPKTALSPEADSDSSVTFSWLEKQRRELRGEIESLTSQQEAIRNRLGSPPESQETTLVEHDTDTTSTLTLKETARQEGASDQSLKWLEYPDIADYTDGLRKAYFTKYETAMNIDQAVASAKFLSDQKLVVEDTEKYMQIAADLVHEFGAALDNFHLNRKTFQVEIVDPSDTQVNRRDLAPLRLSKFGDLLIDHKKLKGSVIASQSGCPFVLILSRRGTMAFERRVFASGTVMPQSGSGNFEDLLGKDMDSFAKTAKREFAEEARGFEIVPETLDIIGDIKRYDAYIRFFHAEAREVELKETITDNKEDAETVGTWTLDIMKLIRQKQLDTNYNFYHNHEESRLQLKAYILEAAFKEKAISKLPAKTDPQWKEYFIDSYDVNRMVDYIEGSIKKVRSQAQNLSWRLRGDDKWFQLMIP